MSSHEGREDLVFEADVPYKLWGTFEQLRASKNIANYSIYAKFYCARLLVLLDTAHGTYRDQCSLRAGPSPTVHGDQRSHDRQPRGLLY
jgi:hypothetical protein